MEYETLKTSANKIKNILKTQSGDETIVIRTVVN